MADAEFWLPSQFLTDEDIVSDCFWSTSETSDEDSKPASSRSPQSTLFGYEQESSNGTPNEKAAGGTLELLNKAAGEVAKMKSHRSVGTGFFDCSKTSNSAQPPHFQPPYYSNPLFRQFPTPLMRAPVQPPSPPLQQRQSKATKNNTSSPKNSKNTGNNNRPLGLPPSAWPPLPGQARAQEQPQAEPMMGKFVGPQRDSVGTGVFLPRQVSTQAQPENKSDEIPKKMKNNKRSQRRNRPVKAKNGEMIQLPSEWVY